MKKLMLAGAMLCTSLSAVANDVAVAPNANDPIVIKFAALGVTVKQINPTPVAGLKELITNQGVLYASPDGQFLMQGTLIDLNNRSNLTEKALNGVRQAGLKEYEDSMIVYKAPNEKHSITVFTDISCGYCRKLHRELDDLLETGFRGREVRLVEDMIVDLDKIEDDTDVMQVAVRRELLELESQLNPVDVMFLYSIIEWVGELADISERVGSRLELMLAN